MKTIINGGFCQKLFYTLFVLIFSINTANSQAYKVRMAMMGNSITYGAGLAIPATQCYPAQLSQMLAEIYGDTCEIKNYGVSARTMMRSAELPLWNESLFVSALKYVPDICLILLGTNDSKPYRWDAWGDEFRDDYLAMIDTFRFRNPYTKFIVCYPPPIWEGHPYGTTFSDSHNDSILVNCIIPEIDTVAKRTGAILIDFHTPFVDSMNLFPDKLHPDIEGSRIMAEILFDKITKTDLIHQVDAGLAFVSSFEQSIMPVAIGSKVMIKWSTIYADSVFLDGVPVETPGNIEVTAEENMVYTLTAKGSENTSALPLYLKTYVPEKSSLVISPASTDFVNGGPVVLFAAYKDQYGRAMTEKTNSVTWTVIEGEGEFGDQTDTSIVFIPTATGKVVIDAREEEVEGQVTLHVDNMSLTARTMKHSDIKVFPNPVNEMLYFQMENAGIEKIRIRVFNILGEQLLEQDFGHNSMDKSKFELNTSGLNQGVYVYVICFNDKASYGQFVKCMN